MAFTSKRASIHVFALVTPTQNERFCVTGNVSVSELLRIELVEVGERYQSKLVPAGNLTTSFASPGPHNVSLVMITLSEDWELTFT